MIYSHYIGGNTELTAVLYSLTKLDAELAEIRLNLKKGEQGGRAQAA